MDNILLEEDLWLGHHRIPHQELYQKFQGSREEQVRVARPMYSVKVKLKSLRVKKKNSQ